MCVRVCHCGFRPLFAHTCALCVACCCNCCCCCCCAAAAAAVKDLAYWHLSKARIKEAREFAQKKCSVMADMTQEQLLDPVIEWTQHQHAGLCVRDPRMEVVVVVVVVVVVLFRFG